jgi:small subunit ribosomal protein S17
MTERSARKSRVGTVISDKMDKTVIVRVERRVMHAKYGKIMRLHTKYTAHDEKDECKVGDMVRIIETRPLSKTKRWRIEKVVDKAE